MHFLRLKGELAAHFYFDNYCCFFLPCRSAGIGRPAVTCGAFFRKGFVRGFRPCSGVGGVTLKVDGKTWSHVHAEALRAEGDWLVGLEEDLNLGNGYNWPVIKAYKRGTTLWAFIHPENTQLPCIPEVIPHLCLQKSGWNLWLCDSNLLPLGDRPCLRFLTCEVHLQAQPALSSYYVMEISELSIHKRQHISAKALRALLKVL